MVAVEDGLYMVGGVQETPHYAYDDAGEATVTITTKMIDGWATCWTCQKSLPVGTLVTLAPGAPDHENLCLPICSACGEKREADARSA